MVLKILALLLGSVGWFFCGLLLIEAAKERRIIVAVQWGVLSLVLVLLMTRLIYAC